MKNLTAYGVLAGSLLALGAAPATLPSSENPARTMPFTISSETTAIIAPLDKNGRPDYVAALNNQIAPPVPAENNGYALWLRLVGSKTIYPSIAAELEQRLGVKDLPPTGKLKSFDDYLKQTGAADPQAHLSDTLITAGKQLWKARDYPALADYLKTQSPALADARAALNAPAWWKPYVSRNGHLYGVMLPTLSSLRQVACALCADATLQAGQPNFDAFLADVIAVKQLTRHLTAQPVLLERYLGAQLECRVDAAIGAAIGSGTFSPKDRRKLSAALRRFKPLQDIATTVDQAERWGLLDMLLATQAHPPTLLGGEMPIVVAGSEKTEMALDTVEWGALDWDAVLRVANTWIDGELNMVQSKTIGDMRSAAAAMNDTLAAWSADRKAHNHGNLMKDAGETKAAYSKRVAHTLLVVFAMPVEQSEETCRQARMENQMVNALLAAATYRDTHGNWPAKRNDLIPQYLATLPNDIYTKQPNTPVAWALSDQGAYVYSVGKNGKDDAGAADDIVVGTK